MKIEHIYIHVPFCYNVCAYCNFYKKDIKYYKKYFKKESFSDCIIKELKIYSDQLEKKLQSIYIGGGTPLCVGCEEIEKILVYIHSQHDVRKAEITVEINPLTESGREKSITRFFKKKLFNRVSIGMQSFNAGILKMLGRKKTPDMQFLEGIQDHFNNISMDFIFHVCKDERESIKKNIRTAIKLGVTHMSFYSLEIKKNIWGRRIEKNRGDADFVRCYRYIIDMIADNGYMQYEISNFAVSGYESAHNINCWKSGYYIGVGPGAYGYCIYDKKRIRYANYKLFRAYMHNLHKGEAPVVNKEMINRKKREWEFIFLAFRTKNGLDMAVYEREFHEKFMKKYKEILKRHKKYLESSGNRIWLNIRGFCLYNEICSDFFI
ncbi:coproporphyrinogen-III oxidase family protein [Spirochaetota bacterium]